MKSFFPLVTPILMENFEIHFANAVHAQRDRPVISKIIHVTLVRRQLLLCRLSFDRPTHYCESTTDTALSHQQTAIDYNSLPRRRRVCMESTIKTTETKNIRFRYTKRTLMNRLMESYEMIGIFYSVSSVDGKEHITFDTLPSRLRLASKLGHGVVFIAFFKLAAGHSIMTDSRNCQTRCDATRTRVEFRKFHFGEKNLLVSV